MQKTILLFTICFLASFYMQAQDNNRPSNSKIEFFLLEISLDGEQEQVELIRHMVKDGWLKREPTKEMIKEDHLLCSFLDAKGKTLRQVTIENPLHKHFEYGDEDFQLKRVEVEVDQEVFQIRLRYNENYETLKIEKVKANQKVDKELAFLRIRN